MKLSARILSVFFLLLPLIAKIPAGFCEEAKDGSPVSVKAELSKAFITIGDPTEFTVTVRHTPAVKIIKTELPALGDVFKVKTIDEFQRKESGFIFEGKTIKLTTFRLGQFILEPVRVQIQSEDGTEKTLETEKLYITVKSVDAGKPKTDIRGVKGVVPYPSQLKKWLLISVGILFAALLALAGWWFWKRRQELPETPEVKVTPEEEALTALNQLFDSDLLRRDKYREYFFRFSEILRVYFEKRYDILAVESTTYEIMKLLKEKSLPQDLYRKIQDVLEKSDLAKFAKWRPQPAEILSMNKEAQAVVEASRAPEEEAGDGI